MIKFLMGLLQKKPDFEQSEFLTISEIEALLITIQNSKLTIDGKYLEPIFNAIIKLQKEYMILKK